MNHITAIRNTVYTLLQRNVRWFDIHQILLELIFEHNDEFGDVLTGKLLDCLAASLVAPIDEKELAVAPKSWLSTNSPCLDPGTGV